MKIALIGYGKMGKAIESVALERGHEIVARITSQTPDDLHPDRLRRADVAIEFTRPSAAFDNLEACFRAGIPVVTGTTAWYDRLEEAQRLCTQRNGTLFYASNFSIGVNVFFALNRYLAQMLSKQPQYHASIEEIHHLQKLDAPSGTALTLAGDLIKYLQPLQSWAHAEEATRPDQLPIESKRIDGVVGTHIVRFGSDIDEIEIHHAAKSRLGFAQGAVDAAAFVLNKKGVFTMNDLLRWS